MTANIFHSVTFLKVTSIMLLLSICIFVFPAKPSDFTASSKTVGSTTLKYRLFEVKTPISTEKYPLIVFLHGAGQKGTDNQSQVLYNFPDVFISDTLQARHPCYVLAPQCVSNWHAGTKTTVEADVVVDIINDLKKSRQIDPNRIYCVGLSMGGIGTYSMIAYHPGIFAAAVACCGYGEPAKASVIQQCPLWITHGTQDPTVNISGDKNVINAVIALGNEVVWRTSNVNDSNFNIPMDTMALRVDQYAKYFFWELLNGYHEDGWKYAWKNPLLTKWIFQWSLNNYIPQPEFITSDSVFTQSITIKVSAPTYGAKFRYTTDGSEPTRSSAIWPGSLLLTETTTVNVKSFTNADESPTLKRMFVKSATGLGDADVADVSVFIKNKNSIGFTMPIGGKASLRIFSLRGEMLYNQEVSASGSVLVSKIKQPVLIAELDAPNFRVVRKIINL